MQTIGNLQLLLSHFRIEFVQLVGAILNLQRAEAGRLISRCRYVFHSSSLCRMLSYKFEKDCRLQDLEISLFTIDVLPTADCPVKHTRRFQAHLSANLC